MKKYISIILITMMLFSILTACKNNNPDLPIDDPDGFNFNGDFILWSPWSAEYKFETRGYNVSGDRIMDRYQEMKDLYNLNVIVESCGYGADAQSAMLAASISGRIACDLVDQNSMDGYNLFKAGLLMSLEEMSTVDLTDLKWGPEKFRAMGIFNNIAYGFTPYYWEVIPQIYGIIMTNTYLISELNLSEPHELIESGHWNWNTFKEELTKGTLHDGDNDYVGLYVNSAGFMPITAAYSNKGALIKKSGNIYSSGLTDSEMTAAIDYCSSLFSDGIAKEGGVGDFSGGTAPYYYGPSWEGTITSETATDLPVYTMDSFGMVSFPFGPNGDKDTISATVDGNSRLLYTSLMTNYDSDEMGNILSLLFDPLPDSTDEGWKDLATMLFHFDEDCDNFINNVENVNYLNNVTLTESFKDDILTKELKEVILGNKTSTEVIDSINSLLIDEINATLNK